MEKLIFVYNADSGLLNGLKDLLHKNISPKTYPCSLCALTYNNLGMLNEWAEFVKQLNKQVEFLHRDELKERFGLKDIQLPAAFTYCKEKNSPELWLDANSIDACNTLDDLKSLVKNSLLEA